MTMIAQHVVVHSDPKWSKSLGSKISERKGGVWCIAHGTVEDVGIGSAMKAVDIALIISEWKV